MADSSTGGFLQQTSTTDSNLEDFFNEMFVGLTGFNENLIRPLWQPDPPPTPAHDVDWIAFGVQVKADENGSAYNEQKSEAESEQQVHEEINVTVVVYGTNSLLTSSVITHGLQVAQNRETLYLNKMAYVGASEILNVPELINGRWFKRNDFTLTFRRAVKRIFEVLNLVDIEGTIEPDPEGLGKRNIQSIIP